MWNESYSPCASCPLQHRLRLSGRAIEPDHIDSVIALAGNPNTGKSTVFNALTGLHQHTGNWPGKTVARAEGWITHAGKSYQLIDLPGTYSLLSASLDEEIARNFVLFGRPDVTVIVVDANRLERNLNLVLQVLEITEHAVVCLNLMDEAKRHGLSVDAGALAEELGVPVVPTSARYREGIAELREAIGGVATGRMVCHPHRLHVKSAILEQAASQITELLNAAFPGLPNSRWIALRLLDGDERIAEAVQTGRLRDLCSGAVHPPQPMPAGTTTGECIPEVKGETILSSASALRWQVGLDFHRLLTEAIYAEAARIADHVVSRCTPQRKYDLDLTLDRVLTNRWLGYPIMILALAFVIWLTVVGANVPSRMISSLLLTTLHPALKTGAAAIGLPWWLDGVLIDGVYLTTAWVVSVMLPPMAIFFPLFTLLEDFGYLPRIAFNLDPLFKRCGAHGKQALTMCMGFGCNAAGVIATRVIDSPRERLIAILTNNFSLCNGRWPMQILLASIFIGALAPARLGGLVAALSVVAVALLGIGLTFATSYVLSRTLLRGEPSTFSLELPPYRPPQILQTLYRSLVDRTAFVLWRAVVFAMPAGAGIWLIANLRIGNMTLAEWIIGWLDPFGIAVGLNGIILLAYVIAIPANEIVIPTVLMLTVLHVGLRGVGQGTGVIFQPESESITADVLRSGGWTLLTAVDAMLFSLVHNPCSTTLYTIWKETGSLRWTITSALLPLSMGLVLCFVVAQIWRITGSG